MNKNYPCLSISARTIQLCQKDFCIPVPFPTAKCFALYLEKVQDFAKMEGCGGEERESGLVLPSRHQIITVELKILALSDSFMGAGLIAEWKNRQNPSFTL